MSRPDVVAIVRAGGADVAETVRRSVIGPGVRVEPGAEVTDSIIFADSVICRGASVRWSIIDTRVLVGEKVSVGERPRRRPVPSEKITIVGMRARLTKGTRIGIGGRVGIDETRRG